MFLYSTVSSADFKLFGGPQLPNNEKREKENEVVMELFKIQSSGCDLWTDVHVLEL